MFVSTVLNMNSLENAIALATRVHTGQTDKAGETYILHPLRVMLKVHALNGTLEQQIAAVLHDTVEDTNVTLKSFSRKFSWDIVEMVDALTRPLNMPYEDYITQKVLKCSSARLIKWADLQDNLSRIPKLRLLGLNEDADRLSKKYHRGLELLLGNDLERIIETNVVDQISCGWYGGTFIELGAPASAALTGPS